MAPFRRPGLAEDDQGEGRPEIFRPRNYTEKPLYRQATRVPSHTMVGGDDESVVSSLSAMSDLESLYVESSAKFHTHNSRDQYLLCQQLPGQSNKGLLGGYDQGGNDRRSSSALLNGFIDENNDDDDNWEDVVFAATNCPSSQRERITAPESQHTIAPEEQERMDFNQAVLESILQQEEDETRRQLPKNEPVKQKRPSKKSSKKISPSDGTMTANKAKKTRKDGSEGTMLEAVVDRTATYENELRLERTEQKENRSSPSISPRRDDNKKKQRSSLWKSFKSKKKRAVQ